MGERALLGGRYELGQAIGSGGFATVFRARDRQANTDVAVKLVPPGFDAAQLGERLRSEAAVLERLKRMSSRHLARIFELGSDTQGVWLVTELVEGVPLSVEALGRALLPHEVLRVARGVLEGLSVAHGAGIVHADVKPSNILVPRTEKALDGPKLIDFGLARVTTRADLARELGEGAPASGVVVGSARWMAPEVLTGHAADMRSDVYSTGLVLFALLGDGELFVADERRDLATGFHDGAQLRARIANDPVLEGRVPPPLSSVLAKMLARDPAKRYRDAAEALAAIIDLDTAPVSTVGDDAPPNSMRASRPSIPDAPSTRSAFGAGVDGRRRRSAEQHAREPAEHPGRAPRALRVRRRHLDGAAARVALGRHRGASAGPGARVDASSHVQPRVRRVGAASVTSAGVTHSVGHPRLVVPAAAHQHDPRSVAQRADHASAPCVTPPRAARERRRRSARDASSSRSPHARRAGAPRAR